MTRAAIYARHSENRGDPSSAGGLKPNRQYLSASVKVIVSNRRIRCDAGDNVCS